MSKGSKRRARAVNEKLFNANWDLVFSELCNRPVSGGRIRLQDSDEYLWDEPNITPRDRIKEE